MDLDCDPVRTMKLSGTQLNDSPNLTNARIRFVDHDPSTPSITISCAGFGMSAKNLHDEIGNGIGVV